MEKTAIIALIILLALANATLAQNTEEKEELSMAALSTKESINGAKEKIAKMWQLGMRTERANDTLGIAITLFEVELEKEKQGAKASYTQAQEKAFEATSITQQAFSVFDELQILKDAVNALPESESKKQIQTIAATAEKEFKDERYEKATELIKQAHAKIIEVQTMQARAMALYEATSKTLTNLVLKNLYWVVGFAATSVIAVLLFRGNLKKGALKKRLKKLEKKKQIILNLIKNTQYKYFEEGKMPETLYKARIELFKRKDRDLNRQIAIAKEEITVTKTFKEKILRKPTAQKTKQ